MHRAPKRHAVWYNIADSSEEDAEHYSNEASRTLTPPISVVHEIDEEKETGRHWARSYDKNVYFHLE
jgi:hypothetical protein